MNPVRLIAWLTKPKWAGPFIRSYWDWRNWTLREPAFCFGWYKLTATEEIKYPNIARATFRFGPLDLDYGDPI